MKISSVILADDNAEDLGDFFVLLKEKTETALNDFVASSDSIELNTKVLLSEDIEEKSISENMAKVNRNNFFCFCFVHGDYDKMLNYGETFISTSVNYYIFSNAFVYTFSCCNGADLADVFILNNVKTFIGYKEKAYCPEGYDNITSDIALVGLNSFLDGKSAKESYEEMKKAYDKPVQNNEIEAFARSFYRKNRDALVIKGNGDLRIDDMDIVI